MAAISLKLRKQQPETRHYLPKRITQYHSIFSYSKSNRLWNQIVLRGLQALITKRLFMSDKSLYKAFKKLQEEVKISMALEEIVSHR